MSNRLESTLNTCVNRNRDVQNRMEMARKSYNKDLVSLRKKYSRIFAKLLLEYKNSSNTQEAV